MRISDWISDVCSSDLPSGTNAIVQLANALAKVGAYRFAPQQNELTKVGMPIVADQVGGKIGAALKAFAANPADAAAIATIRAEPESDAPIGPPCVPPSVQGGHAETSIPPPTSEQPRVRERESQ